ncbi:MAG: DUF6029 family protein [Bacteroidota bacterium]
MLLNQNQRTRTLLLILLVPFFIAAQDNSGNQGQISGSFQIDSQYYTEDTLTGAIPPDEDVGINAWGYLTYTLKDFEVGMRYETYSPALLGYPASTLISYSGSGIGYRYAKYKNDLLDVTVGNFYEQFGLGMIFRSYEERFLGVDNAMDGVRLRISPLDGVYLKGVMGKQRFAFDNGFTNGPGVVRGLDAEFNLNEMFSALDTSKTRVSLGASFVSKYERDNSSLLQLPENVGSYGGRVLIQRGRVGFVTEYVHKENDPNVSNRDIYKNGNALYSNLTYSTKGFALNLTGTTKDNMFYQSSRAVSPFDLNINYLPALTKQHTYNLAATLYPYATQPNGEIGYSGEISYKIKKKSKAKSKIAQLLGGKYGTKITMSYTQLNDLDTTWIDPSQSFDVDLDPSRQGYEVSLFKAGDRVLIKDFHAEIDKKISKKTKIKYTYFNFVFDQGLIQGGGKELPTVFADIHVAEIGYKVKPKHNIRIELQHLATKQDSGNWFTGLVEYTVSPHWSFSVMDQYNYGNVHPNAKLHYLIGAIAYTRNTSRIELRGGRQRAGIFCIGGVCRTVPAATGLTLSVTTSF